jgi:hypothetical protein
MVQSKKSSPEKLATQDEEKQSKNTTQYALDPSIPNLCISDYKSTVYIFIEETQ